MTLQDVFVAIVLIGLVLLLGKLIRRKVRLFQRLYMPSSIIGGLIALLLGPQVLGALVQRLRGGAAFAADGVWPEATLEVWSGLPGLLISVVFAGLFLGKTIPRISEIWKQAGPMVAHGQTLAWGQYVVGITLALVVLIPVWDVSPLAGALIEIGFEGGHGTAAGLSETFAELGFGEGSDLALGLATIGVVAGVLFGTLLINWGIWRGHIPRPDAVDEPSPEDLSEHEDREPTPAEHRMSDRAIDPLSIHIGFVGLAIAVGWLLLRALIMMEEALLVPIGWPELMRHIPLFPLAMIGGVLVQILGTRLGYARTIDRRLMNRISGTALDLLIVAALGTLSLEAIGANMGPFLVLAVGGILWNMFGLMVLARVMFPENWMQNGLANFGQGMGMTVIGLLLVRMSDPHGKAGAMEAFGYKQLLFEPVVGGGLFTAASLPLIHQFGPLPVLAGVTALMIGWLVFGIMRFGPSSGPVSE
ncbi:MAG: sodium:glutamate symporter [Spirochaetaceae bacterium]|nr:MAG: sodium:glutamate symporter [Spirochaetaceae bacterium]